MLILSPRSLHLHHGAASIPINKPLFADPFNAENDFYLLSKSGNFKMFTFYNVIHIRTQIC